MFSRRLSRRSIAVTTSLALAGSSYYTYTSLRRDPTLHLDSQNPIPVTKRRPGPLWSPPSRAQMLEHLKSSGKTIPSSHPAAVTSESPSPDPTQLSVAVAAQKCEVDEDEDIFDLLIVGGGATGAGVALDAASRGLKTACVEREDFSSGTSSKSTKLVHGGVRYLQKAVFELDYEQYKLVKEALKERKIFLETAPHLSHMLPILLPIYTWWQLPYYYAGCKMYDILAGKENMESSYWMGKGKALEAFPMLKSEGLVGGVVYYDGQHNDSRMNISLVMTAVQHGAVMANHTEVVALHKKPSAAHGGKERICGARLKDKMTGEEFDVKCKGVINATGPFSDGVRRLDEPMVKEIVAPSAGVHITLPNYYGPKTMGLLDPATSDGRVIFFLPWQGNVIAGTTDSPTEVSQHPEPKEEEIQWILDEVRHYLSPDIKVRRGDVLSAWSGIRPLVRDPAAKNTQSLVRNHMINTSESGLLTIAGGKWTTYRAMAEETVDEAIKQFKLKPIETCQTDHIKLIGGHAWSKTMFIKLIQQFGLETEVAKHLSESYGDRAWTVAAMAEETGLAWPIHGKRLSPLYPYIEAECRYACRVEYAQRATDFIARRTRLSFLNVQATLDALPRVIDLMGEELGWDTKRKEVEFDDALQFLKSMGLPETMYGLKLADVRKASGGIGTIGLGPAEDPTLYSRAQFSPEEVHRLKDAFSHLDFDKDGSITPSDITHALEKCVTSVDLKPVAEKLTGVEITRMGYKNADQAVSAGILAEVDFHRKGMVEFPEFLDIAAGLKELHLDNAFTHIAQLDKDTTKRTMASGDPAGEHAQHGGQKRAERKTIPVERSGGGA